VVTLYRVSVDIEDEPAHFSASVLVVADAKWKALSIGKAAAREAYFGQANGWAIAKQTRITYAAAHELVLPDVGMVMVSGEYTR
jgi:hypothetical protein